MKFGLFKNSSQPIGPKGLKLSGFDGVVIRKFGEDRSKALPLVLLFSQFSDWNHNSMPEYHHPTYYTTPLTTPPHLLHHPTYYTTPLTTPPHLLHHPTYYTTPLTTNHICVKTINKPCPNYFPVYFFLFLGM